MTVLNGPIEVGVRILILLNESYPTSIDLNRLVLLDHSLIHSADLDGPGSVHPALPLRSGELGIKRVLIERGLQLMIRAHLVDHEVHEGGIYFRSSEVSDHFLRTIDSTHKVLLQNAAAWVVESMGGLSDHDLRERMATVLGGWSAQFTADAEAEHERKQL